MNLLSENNYTNLCKKKYKYMGGGKNGILRIIGIISRNSKGLRVVLKRYYFC